MVFIAMNISAIVVMHFSEHVLRGSCLLIINVSLYHIAAAVAVYSIYFTINENKMTDRQWKFFCAVFVLAPVAVVVFGLVLLYRPDSALLVSTLPKAMPQTNSAKATSLEGSCVQLGLAILRYKSQLDKDRRNANNSSRGQVPKTRAK
jgi:hypothetical protein